MLAKQDLSKENHARFIWLSIQVNTDVLRNPTKQRGGIWKNLISTFSLITCWGRILNWILTVCLLEVERTSCSVRPSNRWYVSVCLRESAPGGLTFSCRTDPSSSSCRVQRSRKSIRHNGWRPSRINEARKSGQPLDLANQEAGSGGKKRRRAACDVHAWTWGFRVMVCV